MLDSECTSPSRGDAHQPAPVIGHAHLTVNDLGSAENLFVTQLSLKRLDQDLPGALFFTHGEYHHYFAANQWLGPAAARLPEHSVGWVGLQLAEDLAGGAYLSHSDLVGGCGA